MKKIALVRVVLMFVALARADIMMCKNVMLTLVI